MAKTPIDALLDRVEWTTTQDQPKVAQGTDEIPEGLYATHEGVLEIAGNKLRVYQLSDGSRVFNADDIEAFLRGDGE